MKLFLVLIILLFEVPKDAAQHRRCFSSISGYCRKKCKLGETYEIACVNGKLCCINEDEKRQYQQAIEPPAPSRKPDLELDYAILPTVTLSTISL
ncbi:beta-defensin 128 [Neophocaena asiaeorientalis asiaeorientalis]|uniref:Beta-defensin n=1 Tax=Neophocaena asiaeorientalis asiaeorientalis TaxID=1706337 RepID=A0A341B7N5_NEOAA|nr:beta-defensin 128 [Neophocaena asiaeorientalis asiaeorientalis]